MKHTLGQQYQRYPGEWRFLQQYVAFLVTSDTIPSQGLEGLASLRLLAGRRNLA